VEHPCPKNKSAASELVVILNLVIWSLLALKQGSLDCKNFQKWNQKMTAFTGTWHGALALDESMLPRLCTLGMWLCCNIFGFLRAFDANIGYSGPAFIQFKEHLCTSPSCHNQLCSHVYVSSHHLAADSKGTHVLD
jgi:hypothetical protein